MALLRRIGRTRAACSHRHGDRTGDWPLVWTLAWWSPVGPWCGRLIEDEKQDRWVLDRWVEALGEAVPQHESRLLDWHDAVEQWSKEDMGGTLDGPSGALRAATTKAWNQWKAKLRKFAVVKAKVARIPTPSRSRAQP